MTNITLPRAVVEQALEALDGLSEDAVCQSSHHAKTDQHTSLDVCPVFLRLCVAATALRAALAQQAEPVEPVWIQPDHLQKARVAPHLCRVEPTQRFPDFVALYTAPPKRKPLTEEEIKDCLPPDAVRLPPGWAQFARAIERAHGIGEGA